MITLSISYPTYYTGCTSYMDTTSSGNATLNNVSLSSRTLSSFQLRFAGAGALTKSYIVIGY